VALRIAVPASLGLFDQLRRPTDTEPSVLRNTVYIRLVGRPPRLAFGVWSRMEISGACWALDFCGGYSLVVPTWPSRASGVFEIHSSKRPSLQANGLIGTTSRRRLRRQRLTVKWMGSGIETRLVVSVGFVCECRHRRNCLTPG
jgi:hypothetical protein